MRVESGKVIAGYWGTDVGWTGVKGASGSAMYEEGLGPAYWLGLVLCIPFSALTLTVRWQERYPAHRKPFY